MNNPTPPISWLVHHPHW